MLVGMLQVSDIEHAQAQLCAITDAVDVIELRLDYYTSWDLDALYAFRQTITKPIIATIRKVADGGVCSLPETTHAKRLLDCIQLKPQYIDIEKESDPKLIDAIKEADPSIKIIYSYHHLKTTPSDIVGIYQAMQQPMVDYYKIVTTAESSIDGLRMLFFLKQHNQHGRIIAHCMGEDGFFSRILNLKFQSPWTYINPPTPVFSHGLSIIDGETYGLRRINQHTQIYALLGKPVSKSPGHLFHNAHFREKNKSAVYVKIVINQEELPTAWEYIKKLDFSGLSITIPLKEMMANLLQSFDDKAINTVSCQPLVRYTNTDGDGAVLAIKKHGSCLRKKVLILGSGGTANGIAMALNLESCQIIIASRNQAAREALSCRVDGLSIHLKENTDRCDIIIGTLPPAAYQEDPELLDWIDDITGEQTLFFDANYQPKLTPLLYIGKKKGAQLIYGEDLFLEQAKLQQIFWEN